MHEDEVAVAAKREKPNSGVPAPNDRPDDGAAKKHSWWGSDVILNTVPTCAGFRGYNLPGTLNVGGSYTITLLSPLSQDGNHATIMSFALLVFGRQIGT